MYYPYFRGKQNELLSIRETAAILADGGFFPIIEPVGASLANLRRTIQACANARSSLIVIANPEFGPHARNPAQMIALLQNEFEAYEALYVGILLTADTTVRQAVLLVRQFALEKVAFIHAGFADGDLLIQQLGLAIMSATHVFLEEECSRGYRRRFNQATKVLNRDGFERLRNRDYPRTQLFSDLHHTFEAENMDGFGDFLIVGNEFREQGGPAYAVAIHVTYIDPDRNDDMHTYHFISDTNDTLTDPAGKFAEALEKLIAKLGSRNHHIFESSAIEQFRELHRRGHYPGLGSVKKPSMNHHIETIREFFRH